MRLLAAMPPPVKVPDMRRDMGLRFGFDVGGVLTTKAVRGRKPDGRQTCGNETNYIPCVCGLSGQW